jgi:hypothetical protein
MADDRNQRPYRSNDLPVRGAPAAAPGPQGSGDPLAELARLIGQNDPFAEFGRDGRRAAPQQPAERPVDWSAQPASYPAYAAPATVPNFGASDFYAAPAGHPQDAQHFAPPSAARQPYSNPAYAADVYHTEEETNGYGGGQPGGYDNAPYYPNQSPPAFSSPMHSAGDDDMYDDMPPTRRRMGIVAIAAVFALAVIGAAGAFGYRSMFGASVSSGPPPVIKADATPSKIVPAAKAKNLQNDKMIYDRVNDRGQGEKVVSREEQPVDVASRTPGFAGDQSVPNQSGSTQSGSLGPTQPGMGSGVVGSEPRKIHTISIRPDQMSAAPAGSPPAAMVRQPSERAAVTAPPPAVEPPPQHHTPVANSEPPVHRTVAAAPRNAPLSLDPDAPPPAPTRSAPARAPAVMRTAAVAQPVQIAPGASAAAPRSRNVAAGGGTAAYAVQISSQRSEAEAQAAFRGLQGKFPSQLGGRQPLIHRVDLGAKGIYFRAMVGPFANANEAGELCSSLKAAGGSCLVQKN